MARAGQVTNYFTFIGGKNTESSALNPVANTAQELVNFDLFRTGELKRRKGLALEPSGTGSSKKWSTTEASGLAYNSYLWTNVASLGAFSFTVIQAGTDLLFYAEESTSLSSGYKTLVDMSDYAVDSTRAERTRMAFASANGLLYVVSEHMQPCYIEYDPIGGTFTVTSFDINVRDFDGIDDGIADTRRPTTLTAEHYYNLVNAGWPDKKVLCTAVFGNVIQKAYPINFFKEWGDDKKYPSKGDVYYALKDDNSPNQYGVGSFSPDVDGITYSGNSVAPKGHFILNAFTRDRQTPFGLASNKTLLNPSDPVTKRPSCVAFFAGRAFYSGVFESDFTNKIWYSQILKDKGNSGKCYQENDPTVEDFNKLLDTDGGVITISEAGAIYAIAPVADYLIVMSSNGVWAVGGTDGGQFNPTSYSVKKISEHSVIGRDCCGSTPGAVLYMAKEGIIAVVPDQTTGYPVANNISIDTIQTDYLAINESARANAALVFDDEEQIAYWFYDGSAAYDSSTHPTIWNKALVFNMRLQAFYDYVLAVDRDDVASYIPLRPVVTAGSTIVSTSEYVTAPFPVEWAPIPGTIVTVGPSGRDYTSIETAMGAVPSGGMLLVDDGTWTVTGNYYRFTDKSVIIKSSSGNPAACILNFKIEVYGSASIVIEEVTHRDLGGAVPVPLALSWYGAATLSEITVTYSKCIVDATGYYAMTSYGAAGSNHKIIYMNCTGALSAAANPGYEFLADTSATANLYLTLVNSAIEAGNPATYNCDKNTTVVLSGTYTSDASTSDGEHLYDANGRLYYVNLLVVDNNGDYLTVDRYIWYNGESTMKVPTITTGTSRSLYFYEFTDTSFQDYGTSTTGYITTSYEMLGDAIRDKSAGYVHSFFNRTETDYSTNESGCNLRMRWDWSNASTSNRWSATHAAYRLNPRIVTTSPTPFAYPYDVVDTRIRVRGQGKTAVFRWDTDGDKDCQMLGWSVPWGGNTTP